MSASEGKVQRTIRGIVKSDKMNKSRVVVVVRKVKHAVYGKYIKKSTKYMVHDEKNESSVGDVVLFKSCRPMSSKKCFQLESVAVKAKG